MSAKICLCQSTTTRKQVCVLHDGDQFEPFSIITGVKQGSVIAPTVFSIFQAAFLSQAKIDVAKGVDITYRTDIGLFKLSLPRTKSKLKEIVELQYADDQSIYLSNFFL